MTKRSYPNFLKIGVVQIAQNRHVDVVLGEAACVLLEAEPLEPADHFPHWGTTA